MEEKKFCKFCGELIDIDSIVCPKCGRQIELIKNNKEESTEKIEVIEEQKNNRIETVEETKVRRTSFGDIVRYILGGLFCYSGIFRLLNGNWIGILSVLIGVSLFPFIYRRYVWRIIRNYKLLKTLQIILPIFLIIFSIAVIPSENENSNSENTTIIKQETVEEKALRIVKEKALIYETNYILNQETGNYDFTIKDDNIQLNAYDCATDAQYLAEKVSGLEKVGNIEFECSKNGETFYYILIENVGSITPDLVNDNTKYFDSNHKNVNTNINTLKDNLVKDYKKACAKYNYKDVLRNPENYTGKQAYWFGEIIQVVDKSAFSSTFRIDVNCKKNTYISGYYCSDTIYVTYYGDKSFIEDDMVKMWGTMDGTKTYTTVLGASVTIPKFIAQYMELQ